MKRETQTIWLGEDTGYTLLRQQESDPSRWLVVPSGVDADELSDLGKAIVDALAGSKEGDDLLEFAEVTRERLCFPKHNTEPAQAPPAGAP
jgi:hypothetical protein